MQESLIYVLGTLYFWKISTHWTYFVFIGFVWNIISVIAMIWVPESPRYLVSVGRLEEAAKAFKTIALWNKVKLNLT